MGKIQCKRVSSRTARYAPSRLYQKVVRPTKYLRYSGLEETSLHELATEPSQSICFVCMYEYRNLGLFNSILPNMKLTRDWSSAIASLQ